MTSADFTIAEFLAWVRTKPAGKKYSFCDSRQCAITQFGEETGREHLVNLLSTDIDRLHPQLCAIVAGPGSGWIWTFGELAKRLEALLPAEPLSDTWTHADAYLTDIEDVARERCSA